MTVNQILQLPPVRQAWRDAVRAEVLAKRPASMDEAIERAVDATLFAVAVKLPVDLNLHEEDRSH